MNVRNDYLKREGRLISRPDRDVVCDLVSYASSKLKVTRFFGICLSFSTFGVSCKTGSGIGS